MTAPAIRVRDLSKQYTIAATRARNETLRQAISAGVNSMLQRRDPSKEAPPFWALRDVSFDVGQGDVIGVIGRNGAGKSTLLKILSRITQPSQGRVEIRGRVGSLLEVGMGFDRELTGRENTYLNGAILGMKKKEIDRKFDEIVAFAEIEQFIDTPVKRYSSGMYTRLAFAVAAHLEPEILIVDEVLAVGDAKFQARCLGKMGQVASEGRTVIFVSHNMSAVTHFCPRAIWLQRGQIKEMGSTPDIVSHYLAEGGDNTGKVVFSPEAAPGSDTARLLSVRTLNSSGVETNLIGANEPLTIDVEYQTLRKTTGLRIGVTLLGREGEILLSTKDLDVLPSDLVREPGRYLSRCTLPGDFLNSGRFYITIGSDIPMIQANFNADRILSFTVEMSSDSVGGHVPDGRAGLLRMKMPWSVTKLA